ncbi:MAG: hypothetical protein ACFFG0_46410 [Candidatus Thorarchaeota archaeon]
METPIPGVYIVKVPETKTRPALLFLEVNPLKNDGKPMKRKGLFIGSKEMYLAFKEALDEDAIFTLIQNVEAVNPEIKGAGATKKLDM